MHVGCNMRKSEAEIKKSFLFSWKVILRNQRISNLQLIIESFYISICASVGTEIVSNVLNLLKGGEVEFRPVRFFSILILGLIFISIRLFYVKRQFEKECLN